MPTLPSTLPVSLGISGSATGLYSRSGAAYNYALAGYPWLSAADRQHPIVRETAPVRKQQFDNQANPGEQSLDGWWLRSQQSFHGGAGQLFADPTQDNPFNAIRFRKSRNVNVWEAGRATMLHAVGTAKSTALSGMQDMTECNFATSGEAFTCAVGGSTVAMIVDAGTTTTQSFTSVTSSPLQTVTTNGNYLFVATLDGVYRAPIPASYPTTPTWTKIYTITGPPTSTFMAFVKSRLILTVDGAIYELSPTPASPPAALPTAKYVSSDTKWSWPGITESSSAIYVVGNNGIRGAILKFVLEADGDIPTLSSGVIAAQLPSGEIPYSALGYLGEFIGIGTNLGARVAISNTQGDLSYGPLLFSTNGPVRAWTARDRFLYCTVSRGIDGASGLYRIDLSFQVGELRFPYATDLIAQPDDLTTLGSEDTSDCIVVANIGDTNQLCFATANETYVELETYPAKNGYLQTSRIRFNTLEPKLFKLIRVRGPALEGPLSYIILDSNDSETGSHIFSLGVSPGEADSAVEQPAEPADFISVKFVFGRNEATIKSGELWAYQLKALPASPRQRLIQLPVWCFDFEQDRFGVRSGGQGSAYTRLTQLEEFERTANSTTLQDFDTGINTAVVVERVSFEQTDPPPHAKGWGGRIMLTLRTI
jgi:hypothetical protein